MRSLIINLILPVGGSRIAPDAKRLIRRPVLKTLSAVSLIVQAGGAMADQGLLPYVVAIPREGEIDTLTVGVFQVERFDSNLFRLPDGVQPGGNGRRSAVTSNTGVGLSFDKAYGQQRVYINAAVTHDHYAPYNQLDSTSPRLTSALLWSLTPSLTGKVTIDYAKIPTDYEFGGYRLTSNPQTTRNERLDVDLRPGSGIHPRLSVYETENKTQDAVFQIESTRATGFEGALIYEFRSGNVLSLYANGAKGESLNVDENPATLASRDYRQTEYGMSFVLPNTGFYNANGRLGYLYRKNSPYSVRNFSGIVGDLSSGWNLTGKTRLEIAASRNLYGSETTFSNYYAEDLANATLIWNVTGKIKIKPSFTARRQTFRASPFLTTIDLKTITRYNSIQFDWAVLRAADFSFLVSHSSRSSTDSSQQFVDNSASVLVRLKF